MQGSYNTNSLVSQSVCYGLATSPNATNSSANAETNRSLRASRVKRVRATSAGSSAEAGAGNAGRLVPLSRRSSSAVEVSSGAAGAAAGVARGGAWGGGGGPLGGPLAPPINRSSGLTPDVGVDPCSIDSTARVSVAGGTADRCDCKRDSMHVHTGQWLVCMGLAGVGVWLGDVGLPAEKSRCVTRLRGGALWAVECAEVCRMLSIAYGWGLCLACSGEGGDDLVEQELDFVGFRHVVKPNPDDLCTLRKHVVVLSKYYADLASGNGFVKQIGLFNLKGEAVCDALGEIVCARALVVGMFAWGCATYHCPFCSAETSGSGACLAV